MTGIELFAGVVTGLLLGLLGSGGSIVTLPALISVVKEINEPRLPSLKGKMAAKKKPITKWNAADLGLDGSNVGAASGTKSIGVAPPPPRPKGEVISGETPEEVADKLFEKLRNNQVI